MIRVRIRCRPDRHHLQLAYTDPLTGTTRTKSANTDNRKQAERAAARWELELQQRTGQIETGWPLFRVRFEEEHLTTLSIPTALNYGFALDKFEKLIGKPRSIDGIDSSVMSRFQAKLRAEGLAVESIRTNLRNVRVALGWAAKVGLIKQAPQLIMPSGTGSRGRALSLSEVCRYFCAIRKTAPQHWPELSVLCKVMWLGGLRFSEALKLDFDSGPVRVDLKRDFPAIVWGISGQKSKRQEVTPIAPDLARFLRRLDGTGRVAKTKLSRKRITTFLTDAGRLADIRVSRTKHATAHDLRRTFGSRWALRVHPLILKTMMRHKSMDTTLTYYVDLDSDKIARQLWSTVQVSVHDSETTPPGPVPTSTKNTGRK